MKIQHIVVKGEKVNVWVLLAKAPYKIEAPIADLPKFEAEFTNQKARWDHEHNGHSGGSWLGDPEEWAPAFPLPADEEVESVSEHAAEFAAQERASQS
ncbi:MAG: hypothetical protein EB060_00445 [Proteobacteria bacterium]|nr:hypothetical protein [Pseudomonadota bacterium]